MLNGICNLLSLLNGIIKIQRKGADVNKAEKDGVTPLYIASQNGHCDIVEALLRGGADVGTMNAPPSGGLRDLVRRRLVTRPHLLTHSKPLPRLRLTALMTASDLLGTLWTVLGYKLPPGNLHSTLEHSIQMLPESHLGFLGRCPFGH